VEQATKAHPALTACTLRPSGFAPSSHILARAKLSTQISHNASAALALARRQLRLRRVARERPPFPRARLLSLQLLQVLAFVATEPATAALRLKEFSAGGLRSSLTRAAAAAPRCDDETESPGGVKMKTLEDYPSPRLIAFWLSANRYGEILASNHTTFLSVDFPPVGSCNVACSYCYARAGKQAMPRARELQEARYRRYLEAPERYAADISTVLDHFERTFALRIGSSAHPLRLFGAGDLGERATFERFHSALERLGVRTYGYSRHLGIPGSLWYSADRDTRPYLLERAKREGRRIAFVRQIGDDPPEGVDLIFPEHRQARRVPVEKRDCPKIRSGNVPGICYRCRRCL